MFETGHAEDRQAANQNRRNRVSVSESRSVSRSAEGSLSMESVELNDLDVNAPQENGNGEEQEQPVAVAVGNNPGLENPPVIQNPAPNALNPLFEEHRATPCANATGFFTGSSGISAAMCATTISQPLAAYCLGGIGALAIAINLIYLHALRRNTEGEERRMRTKDFQMSTLTGILVGTALAAIAWGSTVAPEAALVFSL